ncbi:MAG: flagellar hook-associated protein FlgK [candidate division Zixibacteria bacterium]|jgi:flagellar hook-associated protein 1|nr:flagellar hook-associated protein FlgK [candidate division Zixibacteria bacterium]
MPGLFSGLEIGKRALMAQQLAMNTASHNIANSTTPGYSRQRVSLVASYPADTPQGSVGTGVLADSVRHIRDLFLTEQYRGANSNQTQWETTHKTLSQIESFFNEPSDTGLAQSISDFWNAWENLATNPTARSTVIEKTKVLVNGLKQYATQLNDLQASLDSEITNRVQQINQLGGQIAAINKQIVGAELAGDKANDLRDKRDLLVDNLSVLTQVRTIERPNGSLTVLLGSMALVDGSDSLGIATKIEQSGHSTVTRAVWENTNFDIEFSGGELHALQQLRDKSLPEYQDGLDTLAKTIVEQVNTIHRGGVGATGSTGINFFSQFNTTAMTISLNTEIENDPNLIAASLSGEPGDTRNAQAISELRSSAVLSDNSVTISEFYAGLVGTLGIKTQEASNLKDNYNLLATQMDNAKQSVQGVSIDEEMTNMMKYQRAYEASARMITYIDSALETIISGMGVTR